MTAHTMADQRTRLSTQRWWYLLALAAAVLAVAVFVLPTYGGERCTAEGNGPMVCHDTRSSLLDKEGWGPLLILLLPAALCLVPAVLPSRTIGWIIALALTAACVISGFSVGLFFLPIAFAAVLLAAGLPRT